MQIFTEDKIMPQYTDKINSTNSSDFRNSSNLVTVVTETPEATENTVRN